MVFEIIGKITLYIIGTLLVGCFVEFLDDYTDDSYGIFFGAWLASIFVFVFLIPLNL